AIDQIAQSGLSSLKVIYYSAQLFSCAGLAIIQHFYPDYVYKSERLLNNLRKWTSSSERT
ncbi:hypothetical protein LAV75_20805, partial [Shigella flexneri]|uniref:hypothetical protein n=1 Tax=Shigella flexneri TaxID=623 RepID=UPI0023E3F404